jgi:hypothetical protein
MGGFIEMDLGGNFCASMDWIRMVEDRVQMEGFENTVTILWVA